MPKLKAKVRKRLQEGCVIPAHPLALDRNRKLDERRQRALTRYYLSAGSGGVAVGVHTTQFEIRDKEVGLLRPVLELAAETSREFEGRGKPPVIRTAGICGQTAQATAEAKLAVDLGYDAGLLSLGAMAKAPVAKLLEHARAVAEVIPVFGFYLQPSVGGRILPYEFWREFAEIENVVAIKMAPFNRYQTLDVVRAVAEAGRLNDIALYTGNDDNILLDLVNVYRFDEKHKKQEARITGGLLGHWAVWTRRAIEHLHEAHRVVSQKLPIPIPYLRLSNQVTDANAAFFDTANSFAGCIAGIHEVLRRQRLLEGIWCLNPKEGLSRGQSEEIDRVYAAYPHLNDDPFVEQHLDSWLR
ncbi:MAG: dihydrodipicolinate synthase family protein [Bryobacterales bacterium]